LLHVHHHPSFRDGTIGKIVTDVPSRLTPIPPKSNPNKIKRKSCFLCASLWITPILKTVFPNLTNYTEHNPSFQSIVTQIVAYSPASTGPRNVIIYIYIYIYEYI
jgi:hypothetical protein